MNKHNNGAATSTVAQRLAACRAAMSRRGVPAYLVSGHMDAYYLTGFTGEDSAALITPRGVHLISDGRFKDTIDREAPWARKWIRRGSLVDEIARVCRKLRLARLDVQPEQMTVSTYRELSRRARPTRLRRAPDFVRKQRRIKDAQELASIRRAIAIAEEAFAATCRSVRPGQTELELAARLEFEMKTRGSSAPAFACICAAGANAALPHAAAGTRRIRRGDAVLFDWGARYRHYCSDLTRVIFIRTIPPRIGRIYEIALEAQARAIAAIHPGRRVCDVDEVAREHIRRCGYGEQFGHGLGHGLGLDLHEGPPLSWRSKEKLEAGMVVTVEPGIYLPGVGGVRVEDDVLVTPDGGRPLSNLPKALHAMVV